MPELRKDGCCRTNRLTGHKQRGRGVFEAFPASPFGFHARRPSVWRRPTWWKSRSEGTTIHAGAALALRLGDTWKEWHTPDRNEVLCIPNCRNRQFLPLPLSPWSPPVDQSAAAWRLGASKEGGARREDPLGAFRLVRESARQRRRGFLMRCSMSQNPPHPVPASSGGGPRPEAAEGPADHPHLG